MGRCWGMVEVPLAAAAVFFSCRVDDAQRHYFEDIDEYGYGYDRGGAVLAMLA